LNVKKASPKKKSPAKPSKRLSARAAAKKAGVSHVAVLKAEKRGRISANRDPEELKRTLKQEKSTDLAKVVLAKERVTVAMKRLRYRKEKGELVELSVVNAWVAGMIVRARDILLQIDCDQRTRGEIDRALRELSEFVG